MRRGLAAILVCAVLVPVYQAVQLDAATAQTDDEAAKQAAREISAARERANRAADAYLQAQSQLEQLADEAAARAAELVELQATVDRLRKDVETAAVNRFVTSGTGGIPLLTGFQEPNDQVQAEVLVSVITDTGADTLDAYDVARKELEAKQVELDQTRKEVEAAQQVYLDLQAQAEAEVQRLREIETERLQDEAVRKALAAQQAEERRKFIEEQRRAAEAVAKANPNPGRVAAEAANQVTAAPSEANGAAAPAAPAAPSGVSGASGGTSGGRTGGGGGGGLPGGNGYIDPGIICPVQGSAYGDSWGAPRSGGRLHQGVDMLAPTGTPLYAVVTGSVLFKDTSLGGHSAWVTGSNGSRYYYAHLSAFEGENRAVTQGDVIGYVGDTGNARGTPHLHFEVHPGGGVAVNPYPSVRAAGC